MIDFSIGAVTLVATGMMLRLFLPRQGKTHRMIQTWGTWIGIVITAGISIGTTMMIAGIVGIFD